MGSLEGFGHIKRDECGDDDDHAKRATQSGLDFPSLELEYLYLSSVSKVLHFALPLPTMLIVALLPACHTTSFLPTQGNSL